MSAEQEDLVNLTEAAMVAAVTMGVTASAYAALDSSNLIHRAEATADKATCRSVEVAVLKYVDVRGVAPTVIADLRAYVSGDIADYRIERGIAVGPGCATVPATPAARRSR
jgi:hypothetical protein